MKTRTLNGADAVRVAVSPLRDVKVRDASGTGDGSWTIEGYAAVTEQETVLFDLSWIRVREEIARGAFLPVLGRLAAGDGLVHLNFGHDMNTSIASSQVAANQIGGLELSEDGHGLRFFARVDAADPDAQRLAVKMQRGVVNQASFAFTIAAEELVEEVTNDPAAVAAGEPLWDEKWRILEIKDLFDVCACPQGAYAQTESFIRTMAAGSLSRSGIALPAEPSDDDESREGRGDEPGHQRRGEEPGADHVAPIPVGAGELEAARTRARVDATYRTLTRKAVA